MIGEKIRGCGFWTLDFFRINSIRKAYNDIIKILSEEEYYQKQSKEYLKILLDRACNETEFYKKFNGIYDLHKFPVINKSIIRETQNSFLSNKYNRGRLHQISTSGSTGTPFKTYQNKEKRNRVLAELIYYGNKIGYKVGKKLVFLRFVESGYAKTKLKQFIQNQEVIRINNMSDENLENICNKILKLENGTILMAYPSTLALVINIFERMGITKVSNIAGIITGAEVLTDGNRRKIKEMFKCPIVSRYSNQENGILAQDCDEFNEYHINRADYIIEILKFNSDQKAEEGEIGRIIVTDLFNYAMPMIRYDTGDIGSIVNKSKCKENTPVLSNLEGRKLDMLHDTSGKRLSFFAIDEMFYDLPYVKQYQLIQKNQLDFTINLVCTDGSIVEEGKIILQLKNIFGQDANIELVYSEGIPVINSGKFKYIINLMNK